MYLVLCRVHACSISPHENLSFQTRELRISSCIAVVKLLIKTTRGRKEFALTHTPRGEEGMQVVIADPREEEESDEYWCQFTFCLCVVVDQSPWSCTAHIFRVGLPFLK